MSSEIIIPDAFRLNAYRVLRLPVSASATDMHKAAARMRQAEPGVFKTSAMDIPELGSVSRGDADIRAAVGRLASPVHRIADRLFWFCELAVPAKGQDVLIAMDPAGHDSALRALFDAMQGRLDDAGLAAWVKALRDWHRVVTDDDYWFLALLHEDQGGFALVATTQEAVAVRANAVRLAAEPLILAARAALAAGDGDTVQRVRAALLSLTDTGKWAMEAIDELTETTGTTGTTRTAVEIDPSMFRYVDVFGPRR